MGAWRERGAVICQIYSDPIMKRRDNTLNLVCVVLSTSGSVGNFSCMKTERIVSDVTPVTSLRNFSSLFTTQCSVKHLNDAGK